MPVYRRQPDQKSDRYTDLLGKLANELTAPAKVVAKNQELEKPEASPLVIEDPEPRGERFSVTVLWEDWADIGLQDRSGMILDAYKRIDEPRMLKISRALGLTSAEAHRLGLHF